MGVVASPIAELLRQHDFTIEWGTAGFPAAFIATFRQRTPAVRCSASTASTTRFPGLSQRAGVATHEPVIYNYDAYGPTYGPGHGDGHNLLGVASAGAAIATAQGLRRQNLNATLKYFGSTGEEQLVGKAYAVRAGAYDGLDAFMDWHPLPVTSVDWSPFSALAVDDVHVPRRRGTRWIPAGQPQRTGRRVARWRPMSEYLREKNVGPAGRIHYAVINGGGAPNVTPDICSIWYYVREGSPARLKVLHDKVVTCANAAASASQTRLTYRLNSAVWNLLGNKAAAELVFDNMQTIGPPRFTADDVAFAKSLQRALGRPEVGLPDSIVPLTPPRPTNVGGPSSDAARRQLDHPAGRVLRGLLAARRAQPQLGRHRLHRTQHRAPGHALRRPVPGRDSHRPDHPAGAPRQDQGGAPATEGRRRVAKPPPRRRPAADLPATGGLPATHPAELAAHGHHVAGRADHRP